MSIQNRKADSDLFIKPQKEKADLIFSLAPQKTSQLNNFDEDEIKELCNFLLNQPEIKVEGIFSHLSASDVEHGKSFTSNQIKKFEILSKNSF